ncbi:uncharacterized protein LOC134261318 [Saccostrea cucullata]|uniref:uncharacterized protein LOC134261318 n=1 Tax=Saccostrea cuccullata TaxID=36930 RepID=UPI002ED2F47C
MKVFYGLVTIWKVDWIFLMMMMDLKVFVEAVTQEVAQISFDIFVGYHDEEPNSSVQDFEKDNAMENYGVNKQYENVTEDFGTFGRDFFFFWLSSIHTYCDDDTPAIVVTTHCEGKTNNVIEQYWTEITRHLPDHLKTHLHLENFHGIQFPPNKIDFIAENIVSLTKDRVFWGEEIPNRWAKFEAFLKQIIKTKKLLRMTEVLAMKDIADSEQEVLDMLQFYHDIGAILFFNEDVLRDIVIIDVQWFVDAFKYIIADKEHVRNAGLLSRVWEEFNRTGILKDTLLNEIWKPRRNEKFVEHKENLLLFMQRLGLIAIGPPHFIPCMNKKSFNKELREKVKSASEKTWILLYQFDFLPLFIFHRLVVLCIVRNKWEVLQNNGELCLYHAAAIFTHAYQNIVIAVSRNCIHIQVFSLSENRHLSRQSTLAIRECLHSCILSLMNTFHQRLDFTIGYFCSETEIGVELENSFITEDSILGISDMSCPRHGLEDHHDINVSKILEYWTKHNPPEIAVDQREESSDTLLEPQNMQEPEENNFRRFALLTRLARTAMRIYFDSIIDQTELSRLLLENQHDMKNGPFKFTKQQLPILFPADSSTVSSMAFDEGIMYKIFRNYAEIPAPVSGWAKPVKHEDITKSDDIERIRSYRNEHAHQTSFVMKRDVFNIKWMDLSQDDHTPFHNA